MTPALLFDRVTKRYGTLTAVDALTFDVRPGEMFGLIGPDGAGKTTSIRMLCGLIHADAGAVRVLGVDPVKQHRQITAHVGYLSQRFSLYGDLTIDENIAFFAEIHGMSAYAARRDRLLEMTQLTAFRRRLAEQLSGGMKQKLALACTLVHEPDVIVLDEPTTGVDPVSRREFWKLLSQFLATGITILMSTPYLDEAERCTRVALLDRGRLMAVDTPDALRASLEGSMFEIVAADVQQAQEALRAHGVDAQVFGDRLHVWVPDGARARGSPAALKDRPPATLKDRPPAAAPDRPPAAGQATPPEVLKGRRPDAEWFSTLLPGSQIRRITPSLEDVYIARMTELRP